MSELSHRKNIRRRVRPPEAESEPEFQIAPMVDILLVLLVFFMSISTTEVLQSTPGITLPVAADARDAKPNPGQIIVNVAFNPMNNATTISVMDVEKDPTELQQLLQDAVSRNPLARVVIRADRSVRYEFLRNILESVGTAGIGNVTFSVVDKEDNF